MITHCTKMSTPLGDMLLAETGGALIGAWFVGQKFFPLPDGWSETVTQPLNQAVLELDNYFAGKLTVFTVPMAPQGTEFQKKVWEQIAAIPYGKTRSYGFISEQLASSPRAVGTATGRNPLTIFVPCHRVMGKDGSLTGYAGGIDKKKHLLGLEGVSFRE